MKYLLIALAFSTVVMAAETKIASSEKTLDLAPADKNEIAGDTALYTGPEKVKVNFSCKAKDGHEIKQGETGYDECLQKVKNDKPNSKDPSADIKVNFGN